ncbi:hypothetical protein GCK72_007893 [Caenorhabditis remanei]|uniref:DUF38 domain-containing protein n=1 Tax=Caenorhabditis remanei TaxID=31234 RepID=A0A6A5HNK3_CAERE|nr:hypothetical protein GCK72_007893 [Caenorhabditis remanei]KAF1767933.1 hypothetical protein GCK72_007893 [Caenorhabditis remanei]
MPLPLSYPGFRCLLEYLEAVKRAHIVGRSPGLQKVDKLIPLRLKNLHTSSEEMNFNNLIIRYYDKDELKFKTDKRTFSRQRAESQEDKRRKFVNFFFCGRSIIIVDTLCWFDLFPDFLPVDMKFRVNSLTAISYYFNIAIPFIDPRSFPLKTLDTSIAHTSSFDNPVVKLAKTLILYLVTRWNVTVEDLKKLSNQTVIFEKCHTRIDLIPLIKCHIEAKKDIGTTFMISTEHIGLIDMMFREFEQAFVEFQCDLQGVSERFLPGSSKFSIPINNESRIQVYVIEDQGVGGRWKIVMKPVSGVSGH